VLAYLKKTAFPAGTEEKNEKMGQDNWPPGPESK
jgi:hypothetical protein